jgi:pilus assembly protein CpaE
MVAPSLWIPNAPWTTMQRIAIVDPSEHSRESLRTLLLGVDFVWLEAECARYEYFFDLVSQSPPDMAIVNMDADRPRALQLCTELASSFPRMPLLVVSNDSQCLLQALQRGAKHFLTSPLTLEDLLGCLRKALSESGSVEVTTSGRVSVAQSSSIIAVLGSHGGVGCTTLAVNIGATLATDPNNNVALLDLDMALGDADIALELTGSDNISIADLARNIDRLDMNLLRRALVRHNESGLSVLRHPLEFQDLGIVQENHLERIINLLKISYTHLILDLSKSLQQTDLLALSLADHILLVGQLDLGSLRNMVRFVHTFRNGDMSDKVHIVMNRVGADHSDDGISLEKAAEVIGKSVYWQIPNDSRAVLGSRVAGSPLILFSPKAKSQLAIAGLINRLYGKAPPEPAKKRGWFG